MNPEQVSINRNYPNVVLHLNLSQKAEKCYQFFYRPYYHILFWKDFNGVLFLQNVINKMDKE